MSRLTGKCALVTGAARGIGKASALAMAAEGAKVVMTDVLDDEGEASAEEVRAAGGEAWYFHQDVTDEAEWSATFERAEEAAGALGILMNNAGIVAVGSIEDATLEQWRQVMTVNAEAVFLGTREGVRHMKDHGGGSIINVSSIEGLVGNPLLAAYNASKGAVRLLTKSAALHCANHNYGIRINSIHPGVIMTKLVAAALPLAPEGYAEELLAEVPAGRFGEAQDIAGGVVFLASDDSAYMTGTELTMDGGYTCR